MGDMSGRHKKIRKGGPVGTAIAVIAVCVGCILDVRLGIGVAIGALVGYFVWSMLGDGSAEGEKDAG